MPDQPKRGFAAMPADQQRAIARKAGQLAHLRGVAREWTAGADAKAAGSKGGRETQRRRLARRIAKGPA